MAVFLSILISLVVIIYFLSGLKIAKEWERGLILRLGKFHKTKGPGIYWIIPFIDKKINMDTRLQTFEINCLETLTLDTITINVNAVLWYKITEQKKAVLTIENYEKALEQLSLTAIANIIGQFKLENILSEKTKINETIQKSIDKSCLSWGIKIENIEIKNIKLYENKNRIILREA